jgi:hypothetical protein
MEWGFVKSSTLVTEYVDAALRLSHFSYIPSQNHTREHAARHVATPNIATLHTPVPYAAIC